MDLSRQIGHASKDVRFIVAKMEQDADAMDESALLTGNSTVATHEVASCLPSEVVVPSSAMWEPCAIIRWHELSCDVKIISDGELIHNIPKRFVRKISAQHDPTTTPVIDMTTTPVNDVTTTSITPATPINGTIASPLDTTASVVDDTTATPDNDTATTATTPDTPVDDTTATPDNDTTATLSLIHI